MASDNEYTLELYKKGEGRPPKYNNVKELHKDFNDYLHFMASYPIEKERIVQTGTSNGQDNDKEMISYVPRPLSLLSFMLFIGWKDCNWGNFKRNYADKSEFIQLINTIEGYIKEQQIAGAVSGKYKENIVARLHGLTEKQEQTIATPNIDLKIVGGE